MKSVLARVVLGVVLGSGLSAPWASAEEGAKALPTLLIKGEVVSADSTDPQAVLLKVRDRYGFETPIFVTSESKVLQGDAEIPIAQVASGSSVEVEYNFDVNTAKRQAVSVKVTQAKTQAAEPAAPVAPAAESAAPAAEPAAPEAAPADETPEPTKPAAEAPAATTQ